MFKYFKTVYRQTVNRSDGGANEHDGKNDGIHDGKNEQRRKRRDDG